MYYIHIWKLKDEKKLYQMEGRLPLTLEEAIEQYRLDSEDYLHYMHTLKVDGDSLEVIDIEEYIQEEQEDYDAKWEADAARADDEWKERD